MNHCEICGARLTNPRAKTCSVKCRSIKFRRSHKIDDAGLSPNEMMTLEWFCQNAPIAGAALTELLTNHGKGALLLAYTAMNEYANFLEESAQQSPEVQKAS